MSKRLGIILGSGGARGFAHIGFLQAMEERGIKPDVMTGCSIGAVIGAAFLRGKSPKQLKKTAFSLKQNDLVDFNLGLFKGMSLLRSVKMDSLLKKHIGIKTFEDLPIHFAVIATDLESGNVFLHARFADEFECIHFKILLNFRTFLPVPCDEFSILHCTGKYI